MGLRINTNVEGFNSHRNLVNNSVKLGKAMEQLSSGFRINRAGDDAAGLGISETLRAQIRGLEQAQRNTHDGISLVQTAEGAMQEMHSILHRIRELAVQYKNGVNGPAAQMAITTEVAALSAEIDRMIGTANYNDIQLLNGATPITLQVGANDGEELVVNTVDLTTALGGAIDAFVNDPGDGSGVVLDDIDAGLDALSQARASFGAVQNRLEYTSNALGIAQENMMAAESRIRDVDMAQEMTTFARIQILQESSIAMLAQANQTQQNILRLLS